MGEAEVIARLRRFATDPAARGLDDDVALVEGLVVSHDSIAEGVHFRPGDPPESVGWKLVAVNLSDLAGKGARPLAGLLSLTLAADPEWEERFLDGVEAACESYSLPLVGGDTIGLPADAPRVLGMTVIGRPVAAAPSRAGGRVGDGLWLVGCVGDSAAGLAQLQADERAEGPLVDVYRRPIPLLAAGLLLAPHASAMMDVSDGLLIDASRMARASGCTATIEIEGIPLSEAFIEARGSGPEARMFAATGGDDYALLAALPADLNPILTLSLPPEVKLSRVGTLAAGDATLLVLDGDGRPIPLPERLGFEHTGVIDRDFSAAPAADRH